LDAHVDCHPQNIPSGISIRIQSQNGNRIRLFTGRANVINGDVNDDGVTNIHDINIILMNMGRGAGHPLFIPRADIDGNDVVDVDDLNIVLNYFGAVQ
jgi:hypothetical protein